MAGNPNADGVPVDELWKCFSSALSGMDKACCVIDALDEVELGQGKFLANLPGSWATKSYFRQISPNQSPTSIS
jgi:hypothetical protein